MRTVIPREQLMQSIGVTLRDNGAYPLDTPILTCAVTGNTLNFGDFLHEIANLANGIDAILQDQRIFPGNGAEGVSLAYCDPGQLISYHLLSWASYFMQVPFAPLNLEVLASKTNDAFSKCGIGIIAIRDVFLSQPGVVDVIGNINDSAAQVVIVTSDFEQHDPNDITADFQRVFPGKHIYTMDEVRQTGASATTQYVPRNHGTAIIVGTSATMTGESKFPQNTHLALNCIANGYFGNPALLPQTPGEPICSTLPPTWLTGAVNCGLIQPISGYHTIAESRYDIETVIDTIIRYKCTRWFAAQSQILNIIKRPDLVKRLIQESDLALIYNGGEPMYMSRVALYSNALSDAETQRQIGLFTAYGMTEIASIVGVPVFDAPPDPAYPNLLWYSPMSHIVVRATDPLTGQEMPLGSVGMMQIEKNPCSFTDYAGDPELTKNAWSDDGRWFNTGDATIIRQLKDADGNEHTLFAACGRYDFSFTDPNGNKHWSFEAESVIQSCPNVLDVVVVTDRDNPHGAAAHVVISGGSDTESVKAAVSAALAGLSYKVRTEFYDDLLPVKNRAKRDIRFLQQQC